MKQTVRTQTKRHTKFYVLLCLLMALIITRYSLQIDVPRWLFLGVILLIVTFGDRDETIAMCMCCIPLHESVDFFYAVVFCVVVYILKYPRSIRINLAAIPIVLIILWELLHCLGREFAVVKFIAEMIPFLALLVFLSIDVTDTDYDFIIRSVSLTTLLAGFSLLLKLIYLSDFNVVIAFAGLQRLGVETEKTSITGGTIHPNTLGIICVLTATGLLQLRTTGRSRKADMVMTVLLLVLGTLTASRTFLACLALMVVLLLFSQKGSITQKLRFLGGMLLVLLLALVVLGLVFPELVEYFYKRFLVRDITTGRMDLMDAYHRFAVSNPVVYPFGIGLHDLGTKVTVVYGISRVVPHNGVQEIIIAWGLPGLVLFGCMLGCMLWRSRHNGRRQYLLNYIPLLVLLFKTMAGQVITSYYTMLAFSYAYMSLCADLTPDSSKHNKKSVRNMNAATRK